MKKSHIQKMPAYFDRYINLVEDIDVLEAFKKYGPDFLEKEKPTLEELGDKVYAPGKWTVKDIIQHIIDAERVFCYRALRFARNDKTILHGFEEDFYAANTNVKNRKLEDVLEEFKSVRQSTISLFKSFDKEALQRSGVALTTEISVLALGFTIAGHPIHHMKVLHERYFPLLKS